MAVQDDRPPPVITISDPNRPLEPGDVMVSGTERDPWRPSRGQLKAVAFLLLLASAVVFPDRVVRSRAEAQRAAVAAAEQVRVSVDIAGGDQSADGLPAYVRNDGPAAVTVLDVLVDGYDRVRVDDDAASLGAATLRLPDTAGCSDDLVQPGTSTFATVRVRTEAGRVVTRRAEVPESLWVPLVGLTQQRCGYLSPQDALRFALTTTTSGRALQLRLTATNRGKVPLELGFLGIPYPGMDAVPLGTLPVVVPAGGRPTQATYRVTVGDCGIVRENQGLTFGEQTMSIETTAYRGDSYDVLLSATVFLPSAELDEDLRALGRAVCGASR